LNRILNQKNIQEATLTSKTIESLFEIEEVRAALIAEGVALVEALKNAVTEETVETRDRISYDIENISNIQQVRAALIEAGACGPLVKALEDLPFPRWGE
jgi:hypothetical protein